MEKHVIYQFSFYEKLLLIFIAIRYYSLIGEEGLLDFLLLVFAFFV